MAASAALGFHFFHHLDESAQLVDLFVDVDPLAFQKRVDPRLALFNRYLPLRMAAVANVIQVDHLADFGQAEPNPLRAQYPCQPWPCPAWCRYPGHAAPDGG